MFVGRANEINVIKNKLKTLNENIIIYGNRKEINVNNVGFISINGFVSDIPSLKYKFDGDDIYFKR